MKFLNSDEQHELKTLQHYQNIDAKFSRYLTSAFKNGDFNTKPAFEAKAPETVQNIKLEP